MTDEELDEARAREANRLAEDEGGIVTVHMRAVRHAARLARTGWVPTDPDLIEAREIVAKWADLDGSHIWAAEVRDGRHDGGNQIHVALAAIKSTKAKLAGGS